MTERAGLVMQLAGSLGLTALSIWLLFEGIDTTRTHVAFTALALVMFAANSLALSSALVAALAGIPRFSRKNDCAAAPEDRCAVLWLMCHEPVEPVARRARELLHDLERSGQANTTGVFVLSDSQDPAARKAEAAAFAALPGVTYRNREKPEGRKPGNLRDWLNTHGAAFDTMLVLDADSGFCAQRLAALRAHLASDPRLGLVQAGIALRPGQSRLARLQRLAVRLTGPVATRGLARLSGDSGNFWGHNALLRVAAFRHVARLPDLPGNAPLGGPILSHDFVEAALMRAAGWRVALDPTMTGSFEDAPERFDALMRRDRRWAQGNLQHARLLFRPGLTLRSRLHLLAGLYSYISAPVWLALVILLGAGLVHLEPSVIWALAATLAALVVPKVAGLAGNAPVARRRPAVMLRAVLSELAVSACVAPLWMAQRTGFVTAILAGRDAGWRPAGQSGASVSPGGWGLPAAGGAIIAAVTLPQWLIASPGAALVASLTVMPVALPLLCAPWLLRWLDAPARRNAVAAYYDASTRRFLAVGGSGNALAIHRPLWGKGVTTPEAAAAHVNTLIAQAGEAALGRAPEHVRDLGCGVGGTVFQLAEYWPEARFSGLTLSAAQVDMARRFAKMRGLSDRCHFLQADFTRVTDLRGNDLVMAIESHVHAASAREFLQAALAHLAPGGVLVIVDDMLADDRPLSDRDAALVKSFRTGWRLGHVTPHDRIVEQAERLGFAALVRTDLSHMIQLDRLRDRALRVAGPVAQALGLAHIPLFANMIGGNALTQSYRRGLMSYSMLVLRAPQADGAARSLGDEAAA